MIRPARLTLTCAPASAGTTRPVSHARRPVGTAGGGRKVSPTEVTVAVARVSSPVAEVPIAATVHRPAGNVVVTYEHVSPLTAKRIRETLRALR